MNRRTFNTLLTGSIAALSAKKVDDKAEFIGSPIQQGSTIGLVAPSYYIEQKHFETALENLKTLKLKAHYTDQIFERKGYLAGSDDSRIAQIHSLYQNPKVDAIWCIKGGYGATRILDDLDFELISKNPKPLIGFSDVTSLLNTIQQKTKSPCFHGPCIGYQLNQFRVNHLAPLYGLKNDYIIKAPKTLQGTVEEKESYRVIHPGAVEGRLVGGNLSLMVSMIGTAHEIETTDAIIFIEDVEEAPYRIDRMLTQLISAGTFNRAKAVIFGIFEDCERKESETHKQSLAEVITERMSKIILPTVYGFPFGHTSNLCTIPIGAKARLDTREQSLTILEDVFEQF